MKRTLIRVTKDHIVRGRSRKLDIPISTSCPVALAVAEIAPGEIKVLTKWISFLWRNPSLTSYLPVRAVRFIKRFDMRKPVKPFNFYLMVPE